MSGRNMVAGVESSTKRIFFASCTAIGILISSLSVYVLLYPSLMPSISRINPNYSGLGVLVNKTNISPTRLVMIISAEPTELFFQYYFSCTRNGTYNFLFSFPFNITCKISSHPENTLFNSSSSYGSAVWLSYDANGTGVRNISGSFQIADTFRSGGGGSYTFVLPFGFGVHREVVDILRTQLNVTYASNNNVDLSFNAPSSKYDIIQTFPERESGWLSMPDRSIEWTGARWEFPEGLQQSVIIYCQSLVEVQESQRSLFLGGLFLSIGIQLAIRALYDFGKESLKPKLNVDKMSTSWFYSNGKEIWVKCRKCRKWNRIRKNALYFHPTTKNPYKMKCHSCKSLIVVGKIARAPESRKKPKTN